MRALAAAAAAVLVLVGIVITATSSRTQGGAAASDKVPEEYRDLVTKAGSMCDGITPGIIAAQINQESGWDPQASSGTGAQGISQFVPQTWEAVGKDHNGDGQADVTDPADAIPSQGEYMCGQLAAIDEAIADGRLPQGSDRVALSLAAYNAGLGAVLDAGGVPPYTETQNYVTTIQSAAADYETTSSSSTGASGGDLGAALDWAKSIAADDSHQYVWGAEGPHYDCSGLTKTFMARLGVSLEHKADAQARDPQGTTIGSLEEAQPGDLLFWGDGYYHHVAIYTGAGQMVSADSEATGINDEPIWGTVTLIKRFT